MLGVPMGHYALSVTASQGTENVNIPTVFKAASLGRLMMFLGIGTAYVMFFRLMRPDTEGVAPEHRAPDPGAAPRLDEPSTYISNGIAMMERSKTGDTLSRLPLSRLSFRWQITLLGTLVFILFLAVLSATFATLRYTRSAVLSTEKKGLIATAQNLAREYEDKAAFSRQNNEQPPLSDPRTASSREVFALLSRVMLENSDGVRGGFYSTTGDTLLGSPATSDEGLKHEAISENASVTEEQAIAEVARNAAAARQPTEQALPNGRGVFLVEAVPIRDGYAVVGSAWASKRLPELPGTNRFRAYLITAGLGTAALASVLLTLLVLHNLQGGVRKIESGLQGLERNLTSQIESERDPAEIQRIVQAINRLGVTLKEKLEREKEIESQLRHTERLASLGRLVAGVAHEVRNPLATIRLRVQMCQRDTNNPHVKESCTVALQEIERMNGMVNRLLGFARPVQLRLEAADLRKLAEERMESFRDWALKSGVTMVADFPPEDVSLQFDKDRMAQVFDNIIQNAIEAMSEGGGTLSVTLAQQVKMAANGNGVCIEFRDTGKGMQASVASHVFDPFFTTKPTGTGLGLSICHELVQAHGGDIHMDSEEGRGTRVKVTIPARHV
jgi:signal transduction histidine kinase